MPSLDHESLILLFRNQPALAAQLLSEALRLELPAYTEARMASSDLTEVVPAEFRADAVVLLVDDKPVLGVIVEVQLSTDVQKRFSWPAYVAVLRARHKCPVELLVLTHDQGVATWAAAPIALDLLGASCVRPRVLGPSAVPVVTDPVQATKAPELAMLSVLAPVVVTSIVPFGLPPLLRRGSRRSRIRRSSCYIRTSSTRRSAMQQGRHSG